jgi:hypothetical protein
MATLRLDHEMTSVPVDHGVRDRKSRSQRTSFAILLGHPTLRSEK